MASPLAHCRIDILKVVVEQDNKNRLRSIHRTVVARRKDVLADRLDGCADRHFFEYPGRDAAERNDPSRSMAYQGTLSANRSGTKFVYSSFRGEIIHFYSIAENKIELIAKIENDYPLYKDTGGENFSYF